MSARTTLRLLALGLFLALPPAALGAPVIRGVDTSGYPTIRLSVIATGPSSVPPRLEENGGPVAGFSAENLGRAKSVVLAVDRSRSMRGKALDDAIAAARAFVAAKPASDRIALTAFGSDAIALTGFSAATIDADAALRTLGVDDGQGTALYDALVRSARSLAAEPLPARVIIVVTDGRDVSSSATLEEAIAAVRDAGAAVYPIGIEGPQFSPDLLRELAHATGGTYYGAASSEALAGVYASIAEELRRTWRLEYVTAARPGEPLALGVAEAGGDSTTARVTAPGVPAPPVSRDEPSRLLPGPLLESPWAPHALGLAIGLLILLAAAFAFASPRGSRLRARLAPHLPAKQRGRRRRERERLAAVAALFRATERAFAEKRFWLALQRKLERADIPLRTVELVYLMVGVGFATGTLAALAGLPSVGVLAFLVGGALLPYGSISFRAQRRLRAFENQLPDLLITMAAALKAGHSFRQGMQSVVDEGLEPASKEFKRVLTETRLGRSMDESLADMAQRVGSKNLEFVINAVTIQRQVGGSLAGLFDVVAETVRNRQQFARKVRSLTSMGRASAYVLVALPFFVAIAVTALNAEYMDPLYHTSSGQKLIAIGLGMMVCGSLILRKIVSFRG